MARQAGTVGRRDRGAIEQMSNLANRPSTANYGPGSGGGAYRAYGAPGTYQNQPGLSELGGPRSQNVWNEPNGGRQSALAEWALLQQQYPQYTNHAHLQFVPDEQMTYSNGLHAPANGDPTTGRVALNDAQVGSMSPAYLRYVLAKELGQAVASRTLGTKSSADAYMNAIGYKGNRSMRTPDQLVGAGATWGQAAAPNAMSWEGYRSYPQDLYGLDFSRALGRTEPGVSAPGLNPLILAHLQAQGALPRQYAPPTVPQRPAVNTNDFGRRGPQQPWQAPAPRPAVLPAQVNNPTINAYARVGGVRYS